MALRGCLIVQVTIVERGAWGAAAVVWCLTWHVVVPAGCSLPLPFLASFALLRRGVHNAQGYTVATHTRACRVKTVPLRSVCSGRFLAMAARAAAALSGGAVGDPLLPARGGTRHRLRMHQSSVSRARLAHFKELHVFALSADKERG